MGPRSRRTGVLSGTGRDTRVGALCTRTEKWPGEDLDRSQLSTSQEGKSHQKPTPMAP